MKPKVFVGSSTENLSIAFAIQQNLEYDGEITVWPQRVFAPTRTALESLLSVISRSDFAVFVFVPEDPIRIRAKKTLQVRDNVLFELGLFLGGLGRDRSFVVIPRMETPLHLPTDLLGITPLQYEPNRSDGNTQAALGPACEQIRQIIRQYQLSAFATKVGQLSSDAFQKLAKAGLIGFWGSYFDESIPWVELFDQTQKARLLFTYARSWREKYEPTIRHFLSKAGSHLSVFLPNPENRTIIRTLKSHRSRADGDVLAKIHEAIREYSALGDEYRKKVAIYLIDRVPSLGIYMFDPGVIFTLQPNRPGRRPVPTLMAKPGGELYEYFREELDSLTAKWSLKFSARS